MLFDGHDIKVTVRSNCKRLILRWRAGERQLTLTVPKGVPQRDVEAFLRDRREWIVERMQDADSWKPAYAPGEKHLVLGERVTLGQEGVPWGEKAFESWRAQRLAESVRPLIASWEARLGVRCTGVRFRDMTSRWGSCQTATGRITLNLRLGRVEKACVEYVVAHELCHLLHADHSPAFHAVMTAHMPDWKARRERLNHADLRPVRG